MSDLTEAGHKLLRKVTAIRDGGPIKIAFYVRADLAAEIARIAREQKTTPDVLLNEIVASWLGEK